MPRVSEAHLAARREQIIEAATRCFLRNGFHQTSMQDVIKEAGLSVGTDQVAQGYFTYRSGMEAAERLFGHYNPTAIFASNDDMAAATVAVAHRRGLEVPGDVAVAGFDDTPLATTVWPELTTVRQPIADMAREAVRLLIEQIRGRRAGKAAEIVHKSLKFALIKRESTQGPALPPARKTRIPAKS